MMKTKSWTKSNGVRRLHDFMGMGLVTTFGTAIDGGASIGAWAHGMSRYFKRVIAFEPMPETFQMLAANTEATSNIQCRNQALMNKPGRISMKAPIGNDAMKARYVDWDDGGRVQAITIDSLNLSNCDLIKLDVEGAEPLALDGAAETIARFHPALILEIGFSSRFGVEPEDVHQKVLDMGYREVFRDAQDRFYVYGDEG
jgi:FkbM family methyltransferase